MNYIPDSGDIAWITFNPQAGHEQAGRRPALVVSPSAYNEKVGLALFCPITNQIKGYPFEVLLPENSKVTGAILSDQVKSLDWKVRKAEFADKISKTELEEVVSKIKALLPF
jgi:mRNA interferase MazF